MRRSKRRGRRGKRRGKRGEGPLYYIFNVYFGFILMNLGGLRVSKHCFRLSSFLFCCFLIYLRIFSLVNFLNFISSKLGASVPSFVGRSVCLSVGLSVRLSQFSTSSVEFST